MHKSILILLFCFVSIQIFAQDSTLVGRFSAGLVGSYSQSNIADEKSKGGLGLQFRYFPNPGSAFSLSYHNVHSTVERFGKLSRGINSSIGVGFEKHLPIGNFSPYLGIELGLNITKVKSELIKLPSNNEYFQNNLPNYLFKPKAGLLYNLNDNLMAHFEGSYNWVISSDRENTNPLYDDSYSAIYFGRKIIIVSIGIHYLFNE
ncbi:MAG: hypothetical protein V4683_16160 [Bacteroidota bacterium]